ncbi:hypothetical protein DDIC_11280 [Desulfovibrio desulfuricans]|uniref:Translation initiation factor 2 n=1 Tax=Desulfovibrio desulfuricans TaxID=876 RepID=A0A4P7UJC3_DESDE|nr:hypothetical protein [Desulfovibrio desulfuricans]QCC86443.1 hypothetical protein DDIC_11280 [Desulfovibrio desulfuricans]
MRKSVMLPLLAFLAFFVCPVSEAAAVDVQPLPPQVPARTPSGATNINDVWLHSGGGRLYWNTLVAPRQIALEGARFEDPAAVPELAMTPPADKKKPVRHASRKVKVSKAAPKAAPAAVPKGVGKTSLQAPASQSSAIPPLGAPGSAGSAPAGAGADVPYSSAAASPVGGVTGGGAGASTGAAPAPGFSADDLLPRANARP